MAYWSGNTLLHDWHGSKEADEVGELVCKPDPKHPGRSWVFIADTGDDCFRKRYYERPTAEEVFTSFLNWQRYG